jgi:hypothetical protein
VLTPRNTAGVYIVHSSAACEAFILAVYDVALEREAFTFVVSVKTREFELAGDHSSGFDLWLSRALTMLASSASASSWFCLWIACMSSYNWPIC